MNWAREPRPEEGGARPGVNESVRWVGELRAPGGLALELDDDATGGRPGSRPDGSKTKASAAPGRWTCSRAKRQQGMPDRQADAFPGTVMASAALVRALEALAGAGARRARSQEQQ